MAMNGDTLLNCDFFTRLSSEIEEANKEFADQTKERTSSKLEDAHETDTEPIDDSGDKGYSSKIFVDEEINSSRCLQNESENRLSDYILNEQWIDTPIFGSQYAESQENKDNSQFPDAKVKVSIPLETYIHTPLSERRNFELKNSNANSLLMKPPGVRDILSETTVHDKVKAVVVNKIKYLALSILGQGGTSVVYNGYCPAEKKHVAIKRIDLSKTVSQNLKNEIYIMRKLLHCKNVAQLYDFQVLNKYIFVVLEKGTENLSHIIKEYFASNNYLPEYKLQYYWLEMLYAVNQIHNEGVIHLDLKLSNFIQCATGIKLIDFGLAMRTNQYGYATRCYQMGSPNYICPEALTNVEDNGQLKSDSTGSTYMFTLKSDVWSMGCILYQLLYKKPPFFHINLTNDKLAAIADKTYNVEYPETTRGLNKYISIIKACLQHTMKLRPSVQELIKISDFGA